MPFKDPEPRRRRKEYDRDVESPKSVKSPRSGRKQPSKQLGRDSLDLKDSSSDTQDRTRRKVNLLVPEMERRDSSGSPMDSRCSLPYPSFSKAHSREALGSSSASPKPSVLTPNPIDLETGPADSNKSPHRKFGRSSSARAPPSPPLTATDPNVTRKKSDRSTNKVEDYERAARAARRKSADDTSDVNKLKFSASSFSLRRAEEGKKKASSSRISLSPRTTKENMNSLTAVNDRKSPFNSDEKPTAKGFTSRQRPVLQSTTDSDATSIAAGQRRSRKPPTLISHDGDSPPSDLGSSPKTPNTHEDGFVDDNKRKPSGLEIFTSNVSGSDLLETAEQTPIMPPPPPPPPAIGSCDASKVDYLLQNGGLTNLIPRSFVAATRPPPSQTYQTYASPNIGSVSKAADVGSVFAPYQNLLDNISAVIDKNGSVAVATGYKSVARRLLDRLEKLFSRKVSSEACPCVMCRSKSPPLSPTEQVNGVRWDEVLDLVSGRKELPQWPPFHLPTTGRSLDTVDIEQPMQKLDIDVPDEYRDAYRRQSKKTKLAVEKWLTSQPEDNVSPPQEVDDETLSFAMLTYLEPVQRSLFTALMRGSNTISSRTATPGLHATTPSPSSDVLPKTARALQRLYRLPKLPRDPECSMYLIQNPNIHSVLATLAAISNAEWDILISGRFDAFLCSGAEDAMSFSPSLSNQSQRWPPSRMMTPFSRTTTPGGVPLNGAAMPLNPSSRMTTPFTPPSESPAASTAVGPGGPVAADEATEIAVLAEVEREIYAGMEALEDAFESLHSRAEGVRRALRERSAGLSLSAQARRGTQEVSVLSATPANLNDVRGGVGSLGLWGGGAGAGEEREVDDGLAAFLSERSELAPDDSASNVGGHRRRRRHRSERRTPAPVEEE